MRHSQFVSILGLVLASLVISGCESKEESRLAKAQKCLDQAVPSTAAACSEIVAGIENEKAYLIRCSALYIDNQFVGDRVTRAFELLKNNPSGGQDPMMTTLALMAFRTTDESNLALNYCTRSGVRSLERLATMTSMATFIAVNGGIGAIPAEGLTAGQIASAVSNLLASPNATTDAQLGQLVVQAEAAFCGEGSSFKNNAVCQNLSTAVQSGTPAQVGRELLQQLQQN